ncbi:MAG: hypothetical protein KDK07_12760 [Bauldia sp.]|nr:hypothetical protein [Bauldia sp.]
MLVALGRRRLRRVLPIVVLALGAGACTAANEKAISSSSSVVAAPTPQSTKDMTAADFTKKADYCPPVQIRSGTGSMTIYERGHENEPNSVRYLASVTQTARQCTLVGDTLTIKVGVAGRVVAGPKGSAGNITLPLRIAVVKQLGGTGPLYSQLFKIPVSLAAPTFGANYNQVYDQVTVTVGPNDRNLIVFVGFDEGPKA